MLDSVTMVVGEQCICSGMHVSVRQTGNYYSSFIISVHDQKGMFLDTQNIANF